MENQDMQPRWDRPADIGTSGVTAADQIKAAATGAALGYFYYAHAKGEDLSTLPKKAAWFGRTTAKLIGIFFMSLCFMVLLYFLCIALPLTLVNHFFGS